MLAELKFVMGSIAKKDFLPSLKHFRIENGTIRGFNGTLALGAPINVGINCTPEAVKLVKAIQNCSSTISLSMTEKGRLAVKSGSFKAFIDCVDGETPHVMPEGEFFDIDGKSIYEAIKVLSPFIGDDASRPWSNGVLFRGQSAFATNNVIAVEYWVGTQFPIEFNLPESAIIEMLRIGEPPVRAQYKDSCLSFHYPGDKWIRTQLLDCGWPDIGRIVGVESKPVPFDERIYDGLDVIKPFLDKMGRVYIKDGIVSTCEDVNEGASYEIPALNFEGVYAHQMLMALRGVAKTIDYSKFPAPSVFFGDRLRGAIIGFRL